MVKQPHLLNLGNPRKVKENLARVLDAPALDKIEAEIASNAVALYRLGLKHYRFALKQSSRNWRQKTSRLYYAAYNVSRCVRLFVNGDYSTEVGDHRKCDKLPDDFPHQATYANQLAVLRADRNTCDYDHLARASALVLDSVVSTALVTSFLQDSKQYLRGKGLIV